MLCVSRSSKLLFTTTALGEGSLKQGLFLSGCGVTVPSMVRLAEAAFAVQRQGIYPQKAL